MKRVLLIGVSTFVTVTALSLFSVESVSAQTKILTPARTQVEPKPVKTVTPNPSQTVPSSLKIKANEPGGQGVTCCTHWNSSTGGTGCATFPEPCPGNTFKVECTNSGCW